jgi:hypothetical protein
VRAFLNALQAKDRDRLAEATALRSQTEASTEKTKELFGRIVDLSISDAEIDDLAKKLQGFYIAGENAPKSTGRLGIYIDKPTAEGSVLRFTLTVRKEKKGWGVMDMSSNPIEFKPMGNMNLRRRASGRGLTLILPCQPVRGSHAGLLSPREQAARRIAAVTESAGGAEGRAASRRLRMCRPSPDTLKKAPL